MQTFSLFLGGGGSRPRRPPPLWIRHWTREFQCFWSGRVEPVAREHSQFSVLILSGGGGVPPLWCLSTPKFSLIPTGLIKIYKKCIVCPSGFTTNRVLAIWNCCLLLERFKIMLNTHFLTRQGLCDWVKRRLIS